MKRTLLDSGVLIAAWRESSKMHERALEIISDSERELVMNQYLSLEVLPQPTYHKRDLEIEFMRKIISRATRTVDSSNSLCSSALDFAGRYGLDAVDALHVATAASENVDEFVTGESPDTPLLRVREFRTVSIAPPEKKSTWSPAAKRARRGWRWVIGKSKWLRWRVTRMWREP